jgi:hypothetical protein
MINLIVRRTNPKNGKFEQGWAYYIINEGGHEFHMDYRRHDESQVDLDVEFRQERSQVLISNFARFLRCEKENEIEKKQYESEAITRLDSCLKYLLDHKTDIEIVCNNILKAAPIMEIIARYEKQFLYYNMIVNEAKKQLEWEEFLRSEVL